MGDTAQSTQPETSPVKPIHGSIKRVGLTVIIIVVILGLGLWIWSMYADYAGATLDAKPTNFVERIMYNNKCKSEGGLLANSFGLDKEYAYELDVCMLPTSDGGKECLENNDCSLGYCHAYWKHTIKNAETAKLVQTPVFN
ncbi:MAG: hypothetical protein FIA99_15080, partial [Ruminiclostridium sp.]|nr:hypothetical protein [Ruminiclostridium sp.]